MPQSQTRRQDSSIQALRGLAVILLVAFHVVGSSNRGLRVPDASIWHYCSLALEDIRMPLFTLISGYVYAMTPIGRWTQYPGLMKGKSRRLLLPLVTVGTVLYVLGHIVPGTNFDEGDAPIWRVYVFGFEHLWFLQAIFVIFAVVGVLDSVHALDTRTRWVAAFLLAAAADVFLSVPVEYDVFTVSGAISLLPYFLLGYALRRHELFDLRGRAAWIWAAAFAVIYSGWMVEVFGHHPLNGYLARLLTIAVGTMGVVLIYSARRILDVRILSWIGGFSFGIYLLHVFVTSATRMGLERVGVNQTWELFICGLIMGIAVPIAIQLVFRNVGIVRTFVFGERGFDLIDHLPRAVRRRFRPEPAPGFA